MSLEDFKVFSQSFDLGELGLQSGVLLLELDVKLGLGLQHLFLRLYQAVYLLFPKVDVAAKSIALDLMVLY